MKLTYFFFIINNKEELNLKKKKKKKWVVEAKTGRQLCLSRPSQL